MSLLGRVLLALLAVVARTQCCATHVPGMLQLCTLADRHAGTRVLLAPFKPCLRRATHPSRSPWPHPCSDMEFTDGDEMRAAVPMSTTLYNKLFAVWEHRWYGNGGCGFCWQDDPEWDPDEDSGHWGGPGDGGWGGDEWEG